MTTSVTEPDVHYLSLVRKASPTAWSYKVAGRDGVYGHSIALSTGAELIIENRAATIVQIAFVNDDVNEHEFSVQELIPIDGNGTTKTFHIGIRDFGDETWNIARSGDPVFTVKQPPPTGNADGKPCVANYYITYKSDTDWTGGTSSDPTKQRALSIKRAEVYTAPSSPDGSLVNISILNSSAANGNFTVTNTATVKAGLHSEVEVGSPLTGTCIWNFFVDKTQNPGTELTVKLQLKQ